MRRKRQRLAQQVAQRYRGLRAQSQEPAEAERRAFDDVLARGDLEPRDLFCLYEDFLRVSAPEQRRRRGVFYTPIQLVGAQVRLIDDVLRSRLGCEGAFADARVLIVDPAAGSG